MVSITTLENDIEYDSEHDIAYDSDYDIAYDSEYISSDIGVMGGDYLRRKSSFLHRFDIIKRTLLCRFG